MSPTPEAAAARRAGERLASRWPAWLAGHRFTASGGLVADAATGVGPETVFRACTGLPHVLFLESALPDEAVLDERASSRPDGDPSSGAAAPRLGRYSFVAADPLLSVRVEPDARPTDVAEMPARLRAILADLATPTIPGLPPFQGGIAGAISYDYGLLRIGLAPPAATLAATPLVSLHVYDTVFAFDHVLGRGWFISQGLPGRGGAARRGRAMERLDAWLTALSRPPTGRAAGDVARVASPARHVDSPRPAGGDVRATHTPDRYAAMVAAGIDFVRAGDIFQVNLAQQFVVDASVEPRALASAAHDLNPAPFAGALDMGTGWIVSMSPERFLQVRGRTVRMHPIKGTRRRIASPEADLYAGEDLEASAKDRAENVMIVDLVRNDLARVCTPPSVRVDALCRLERYRYVQHLVSVVSGTLRPGLDALAAFEAAIPAGSVTGAPKRRACEIISSLEGVARGAYCGSLGYIGFDGTADFNLLIRTFIVEPGRVTFAAGGGITAASDPAAEHAESLHKAEGLLRVLAAVRAGDRDTPR